jgi:predicted Zn-dependent peptidase
MTHEIKRFYPEEPKKINQKEIVAHFPISIPMFNIGYKDLNVGLKGKELLRKELATEILLDMLFKRGSELYEKMYLDGTINENFGAGYTSQVDYAHTLIGGESKDPHKVRNTINEYIEKYKKEGLKVEDFDRIKKKKIGNFLKYFDSVEFIANNFISYKFKEINLIDYLEELKAVKFEEVENRLKEHFNEEFAVMSIVQPK